VRHLRRACAQGHLNQFHFPTQNQPAYPFLQEHNDFRISLHIRSYRSTTTSESACISVLTGAQRLQDQPVYTFLQEHKDFRISLCIRSYRSTKTSGSACISVLTGAQRLQDQPVYPFFFIYVFVKLKLSHYTSRSVWGERRYSSYSFSTSALDGLSDQRHAPAALYPRGKDPRYPLYRRLGGPRSRFGHTG
jgi:hypothetical protein